MHQQLDRLRRNLLFTGLPNEMSASQIKSAFAKFGVLEPTAVLGSMQYGDVPSGGVMVSPGGRFATCLRYESEGDAQKAASAAAVFSQFGGKHFRPHIVSDGEINGRVKDFYEGLDSSQGEEGGPGDSAWRALKQAHDSGMVDRQADDMSAKASWRSTDLSISIPKVPPLPVGARFVRESLEMLHKRQRRQDPGAISDRLRQARPWMRKMALRAMVPSKNALAYFLLEYDVVTGAVKVSYHVDGKVCACVCVYVCVCVCLA